MRIRSSIPALAAVVCGLWLTAPAAAQQEAPDEQEWPAAPAPPKAGMPRALAGPTVLDRLEQMSPAERQRVLDRLPPERRSRLEERLAAYDRLPPDERERLRRQYERFNSLSPEQQRFAKAFRAMQLESTLFGIAVIQIKPQLEKVLKLPDDSLTKEIALSQDVLNLFMEFQIPTDLVSFSGPADAPVQEKIDTGSSAGGDMGCTEASGGGLVVITAVITLAALEPSNARLPVNIS